ncbi:MAG: SDR family oxidoreductase [Planctomycetes bacterium]|nr:SDR family oxidoreductase [Planctomycetota bacterium]
MTDSSPILIIGNSDGIGLATTRLLLDEGRRVLGISRSPSPVEHDAYEHLVGDVTAPGFRAALAERCERYGDLTTCIHCAAIGNELDPTTFSGERRVFEVNLVSVVTTLEVLVPRLIARGGGHVVVLSSLADVLNNAGAPSYSGSKAGLSTYLGGLALRLRPAGVRVTNVRFGFVDTKMADSPVRPLMITTERAARVLRRCLDRRPMRVSYPRTAALLVNLLRWWLSLRVWWGR